MRLRLCSLTATSSVHSYFIQYKGKGPADGRFGAVKALLALTALVVGEDDLARMCQEIPRNAAASRKDEALVMNPMGLSDTNAHFKARYNDLKGKDNLNIHFFAASGDLSNIPEIPLGLPGKWTGMTLRSLLADLCCPTPGWIGCKVAPDPVEEHHPVIGLVSRNLPGGCLWR